MCFFGTFRRYLENEGIEYLRTYLHLPSEIVPSTLKRAARSEPARARPSTAPRSGDASKTDRESYRRAPGGAGGLDKKGDVGAGTGDVEFVSVPSIEMPFLAIEFIFNELFFYLFQRGGFGRGSRPQ